MKQANPCQQSRCFDKGDGMVTMFYDGFVKYHADRVDLAQERLFAAQKELIEAYKRQWAEMNYLIENGMWDEKAVYLANSYGLQVDEEMYVFQLNAPLPFLPNPYYMRFNKSREEYVAAKLLIITQLRDVIDQLGPGLISQPAALLIKHYYRDVRIFDMDNKAKQVLINTLRQKLIVDDNVKAFSYYSEEAIQAEEDRTMLYLCPAAGRVFMEREIVPRYPRIDHLPEVVTGKHPRDFFPRCPPGENDIPTPGKVKNNVEATTGKNYGGGRNFM